MENTNDTSLTNIAYSSTELEAKEENKFAYLLAEVSIFNNRVVWYLEQQQKQEIFGLGATGLLWAYILKEEGGFSLIVAIVPPIITAALYIKSIVMTKAMGESMDYLEKLENSFSLKNELGWVHFYKKNTSNYKRRWRKYFWRGLLLINMAISCSFIYVGTQKKDAPDLEKSNVEIRNPTKKQKIFVLEKPKEQASTEQKKGR